MSKKNSKGPSGLAGRISKMSLSEKPIMIIATVYTAHIVDARAELKKCGIDCILDFEIGHSGKSLVSARGNRVALARAMKIKAHWMLHICQDSTPELV